MKDILDKAKEIVKSTEAEIKDEVIKSKDK